GRDTLSDEAPAEGCDRDGPARTRLQSHARDEYHRCSTTPGGDEGIVALLYAFDLETKRGDALAFTSEGLPERKGLKLGKMTNRGYVAKIDASILRFSAFLHNQGPLRMCGGLLGN